MVYAGDEENGRTVGFSFSHTIVSFTPSGVLAEIGVTPVTHGPMYYTFLNQITSVMETEITTSANMLNGLLKETYSKDMMDISEYRRFPRYIETMELALSRPEHIGMHWSRGNRPQADFINTGLLGDLGDLQRIQRAVNPAGSLRGWVGVYNAWLLGTSNKYEEVVNARLDMMESEGIAPFWQLIEDGNGPYAYPTNGPKRTLLNFRGVYQREMRAAYARCVSAARALTSAAPTTFEGFAAEFVSYEGKTYYGFTWRSQSGKTVFSISGQTSIDAMGRTIGRGFMLDAEGAVLKAWRGWLPR